MNKKEFLSNFSPRLLNKVLRILCLTLAAFLALYFSFAQVSLSRKIQNYQEKSIKIAGEKFTLLVANTNSERSVGLSAIDKLPKNYGMLFKAYPGSGIWMKDMKYPIDIIWVDSENKISYLVDSAQPSSYPEIIYKNPSQSSANDAYIIEINSGEIKRLQLKLGDEIILN